MYLNLSENARFIVKKFPKSNFSCNSEIIDMLKTNMYDDEILTEKLMNFFSVEICGFCLCGVPEDTYELIRKILTIRSDATDIGYEEVLKRYNNECELNSGENHNGALQFILYLLDSKNIVEHGSSICGCWLTNFGKMYLTVLNKWHEYNLKNEV